MARKITRDDIGKRAIYTDRNGSTHFGVVNDISGVSSSPFISLKLEGRKRERFYVPEDTVTLVPEELSPLLGNGDSS